MQTLLSLEHFKHAVNLQSIEVKNRNPLDATTLIDLAERHAEPQTLTTSIEHRPGISKFLTFPDKIKEANQMDNQCI